MQNLFFVSDHTLTQKIADKIMNKYLPEESSSHMVVPPSSHATLSSASTLFWLNQQGQFMIGTNQMVSAYLRLVPTIVKILPEYEEYTPAQLLEVLNTSPQQTAQFPTTLQTQIQFISHQFQSNPTLYAALPALPCRQLTTNTTPSSPSPVSSPATPSTPPSYSADTPPLPQRADSTDGITNNPYTTPHIPTSSPFHMYTMPAFPPTLPPTPHASYASSPMFLQSQFSAPPNITALSQWPSFDSTSAPGSAWSTGTPSSNFFSA